MEVYLKCDATLSNDHETAARWQSVELEGPETETAANAFDGLLGN